MLKLEHLIHFTPLFLFNNFLKLNSWSLIDSRIIELLFQSRMVGILYTGEKMYYVRDKIK